MKQLTNKSEVKWDSGRGYAKRGYVYYGPEYYGGTDRLLTILQHATVLHGDDTQEQRIAAANADLDARVEIEPYDVVEIEGKRYRLHYLGDYADAFKGVLIPA